MFLQQNNISNNASSLTKENNGPPRLTTIIFQEKSMFVALLLLYSYFNMCLCVQMFLPREARDWFVVYGWDTFLSISLVLSSFWTAGAILRLLEIVTHFKNQDFGSKKGIYRVQGPHPKKSTTDKQTKNSYVFRLFNN